jgi:hypothetical protein
VQSARHALTTRALADFAAYFLIVWRARSAICAGWWEFSAERPANFAARFGALVD